MPSLHPRSPACCTAEWHSWEPVLFCASLAPFKVPEYLPGGIQGECFYRHLKGKEKKKKNHLKARTTYFWGLYYNCWFWDPAITEAVLCIRGKYHIIQSVSREKDEETCARSHREFLTRPRTDPRCPASQSTLSDVIVFIFFLSNSCTWLSFTGA